MISTLDHGAGNLGSVVNAFRLIGVEVETIHDVGRLMRAQAAVLPGVGSFGDAAASLRQSGLWQSALDFIAGGRPFLGIYLGMQLFFEESEGSPGVEGLSILPGKVCRIPDGDGLKTPYIGWNSLTLDQTDGLFRQVQDQSYTYFVHPYYLHSPEWKVVSSHTQYGVTIDASVQSGNMFAIQFHLEKGGQVGLQMLRNFARMAETGQEGRGSCRCMPDELSCVWMSVTGAWSRELILSV